MPTTKQATESTGLSDANFPRTETGTQAFARQCVESLDALSRTITPSTGDDPFGRARSYLAIIQGAVGSVAEGENTKVNYDIATKIVILQEEIRDISGRYAYLTCYPDVIRVRNQVERAAKHFPVLNEISKRLVDYRPGTTSAEVRH